MMKQLIKKCPDSLINKEIFKFGVDGITFKSYQDEIAYSKKNLMTCLNKSVQIEEIIQNNFEQKKIFNEKLISGIVYDFEKVKENRLKLRNIEEDVMK